MDWEERYRLEYNKREIDKRIKNLSAAAHGYNASILPYITDKTGKYSERKTGMFIKELLSGGKYEADRFTLENRLSDADRSFFESFFYCSIRCYGNDLKARYGILEPFERCSTFQHILDKAKLAQGDTRFRTYADLIENEHYNLVVRRNNGESIEFYPLSGYFATMDCCYEMISGKRAETIDENAFTDRGKPEWKYIPMPYEVAGDGAKIEVIDDDTEDDHIIRERRIAAINDERSDAWNDYVKSFGNTWPFINHYRRYRDLFFKVTNRDIYDMVDSMCTDFLYRKGLLPYSDDDDMTDEVIDLERAIIRIGSGIRRRRDNE